MTVAATRASNSGIGRMRTVHSMERKGEENVSAT